MRAMPVWFRVGAALLLAWNLIGAIACVQQFRLGAEAMGPATDYDRQLFAAMPVWYNWLFAAAEATGVAGTLALVFGRGVALPLLVASLAFVVIQFGYLFATSDIIAIKGVWTTYFPAVVVALGLLQIALARLGVRRAWLR